MTYMKGDNNMPTVLPKENEVEQFFSRIMASEGACQRLSNVLYDHLSDDDMQTDPDPEHLVQVLLTAYTNGDISALLLELCGRSLFDLLREAYLIPKRFHGKAGKNPELLTTPEGDVIEEKKKLVRVTKECVDLALEATKPWGTMGDMGYVCNKHAVENGYSVVREIGGHGCGVQFHEEPWVNHIGEPDEGILFVPGMTFTIEPMVNMGKPDVWEDEDDGWTIRTEDGKPSAQWEYTILVTEDGTEILSH